MSKKTRPKKSVKYNGKVEFAKISENKNIICPKCGRINKVRSPYDYKLIKYNSKKYIQFFRICECGCHLTYLETIDMDNEFRFSINPEYNITEIKEQEGEQKDE